MTSSKHFKKAVRTFAADHSLSYTEALAILQADQKSFIAANPALQAGIFTKPHSYTVTSSFDELTPWGNIVLGESLENEPITTNLSKNHHLLIFGETGSGKTSMARSIAHQLMLRHWVVKVFDAQKEWRPIGPGAFECYTNHFDLQAQLLVEEVNRRDKLINGEKVSSFKDVKSEILKPILLILEERSFRFANAQYGDEELPSMNDLAHLTSVGADAGVFLIFINHGYLDDYGNNSRMSTRLSQSVDTKVSLYRGADNRNFGHLYARDLPGRLDFTPIASL